MSREISRVCIVCEKSIQITVSDDETVRGGHFFGTSPRMPEDEYLEPNITDSDELEIWECPDCYAEADKESVHETGAESGRDS